MCSFVFPNAVDSLGVLVVRWFDVCRQPVTMMKPKHLASLCDNIETS